MVAVSQWRRGAAMPGSDQQVTRADGWSDEGSCDKSRDGAGSCCLPGVSSGDGVLTQAHEKMKAAKGLRRMKNRVGTGVWLASGRQGLRLAMPLALACAADKWRTRYPLRGGGAGHGARTARLTEGSGVFSCVWPAKQQIRWDLGTGALALAGAAGELNARRGAVTSASGELPACGRDI